MHTLLKAGELRIPQKDQPLKILFSACLSGLKCGYDGSSYGEYPIILKIIQHTNTKAILFCPEEFSFGTPREMCDIHGGSGLDVLNGKAKVLTESGKDWTEGMIKSSQKMLELAIKESIDLAIMMDTSAACGSQVIYDGNRFAENKRYQIGEGVCTAQLRRHGFKVISQRDFASLEVLLAALEENYVVDKMKIDHHQSDWYKSYFST